MAAKNNNDSVGILMSLNEQEKPKFWLNPSYFHDILRFFRLFRDFTQYNFTIRYDLCTNCIEQIILNSWWNY